jgi:hypothetical protein
MRIDNCGGYYGCEINGVFPLHAVSIQSFISRIGLFQCIAAEQTAHLWCNMKVMF